MLNRDVFDTLPIEVLLTIFSYLSPEAVVTLTHAKKFPISDADANLFWREKCNKHFPHIFKTAKLKNNINWYVTFRNAYEDEYSFFNMKSYTDIALPTHTRKLFSLIKEADVNSLDGVLTLADLDLKDKNGMKLLNWASKANNQRLYDYLYQQLIINEYHSGLTIDVTKTDGQERTILHWAIHFHQPAEEIELLILQGADIHAASTNGTTPLHIAAHNGHFNIAKLLLENHANIDAANTDDATPLYLATQEGCFDVVKLLLENGANIHAALKNGTTLLYIAAQEGHFDIVKLLLENSANIHAARTNGTTPLYIAAKNGYFDIVKLLLENGANIHATLENGTTPLLIANETGHTEIALAINKHHLLNYLEKTNNRPNDDYHTYNFLGYTFDLRFFGACSAKQKKDAAAALKRIMLDQSNESLSDHQEALNNGELKDIYRGFNS